VSALYADSATSTGTALSPPVLAEESPLLTRLFRRCAQFGRSLAHALWQRLLAATKPAEQGVVAGAVAVLVRGRPALIAEHAFLRQQLLILRRGVKRPRCTPAERALLVLLASRLRAWRQALLIVQPETVLRWHRQGFRLVWRGKSRPRSAPQPKVATETIALIREMAAANRLWGAERIRGEILKLGIRVAKTTVQRHMRDARPPRRPDLGDVSAQPRERDLGLRFPPGH
jgi:putative transposase